MSSFTRKQFNIYQAILLLVFSLSLMVSVQATTDGAVQTEIPQAECETLITLYDNTNGDNWIFNTGWKQTNTPCNWKGITSTHFYFS